MLIPYSENLCSKYAEKMISIKINNDCNMRCSFCVDRDGHNGGRTNVAAIATEAIKLGEYRTVIITGGEPFIIFYKVIELLKILRPHKNRIVLNTNGSLLSPEKVELLNGLIDELQISIHNPEEKLNGKVFGDVISFNIMKEALKSKKFTLSINSTFNNSTIDKTNFVKKMIDLCIEFKAINLRLTELKKVNESTFLDAKLFFDKNHKAVLKKSAELITTGCTCYYTDRNINVSVKRLCSYAKGENAKSFSCCFIDEQGEKKINVDTEPTFRVIYSNGRLENDWIFKPKNKEAIHGQSQNFTQQRLLRGGTDMPKTKTEQIQ